MSKAVELEKLYDPKSVEPEIYALWESSEAFVSRPDDRGPDRTYTIVIPPPNVTGALHLGHALNNTLQDILTRYHRMRGFNTLWQPGTDHAGIATQAVVERRIREAGGPSRNEMGREKLVERIWKWKDEYEARILSQLKLMGCSCDWSRNRFTLDDGLAAAVRTQFFNMFRDGLIFRGKRLVNWDTDLQTAVANDEVYYESVKGSFWHIRYPVIDPKEGEPSHVVIATTRPETMLGDVAVAVHPDPAAALDAEAKRIGEEIDKAAAKDRPALAKKLDAISERRKSHLKKLQTLARMAGDGRKLRLPLVDREIPLITDEWAKPLLGSGCVKITPAHDPNDYAVWERHRETLGVINVLTPDGKIAPIIEVDGSENANSAKYAGLEFTGEGRQKVVADLEELGLLGEVEARVHEVGHSDRSKTPIEPFLSDQWFVRTGEEEGTEGRRDEGTEGVSLGDGSTAPGLAQAAMDVVANGSIQVFPPRYAKSYLDWLGEKRDWCISRQLWWGHRIPVWKLVCRTARMADENPHLGGLDDEALSAIEALNDAAELGPVSTRWGDNLEDGKRVLFVCYANRAADGVLEKVAAVLAAAHGSEEHRIAKKALQEELSDKATARDINELRSRFRSAERDPDVLDTWFSSALWPFSTLGWPEETEHLKQYYPTSVLCTSRDIITNWVARMVMFGLYSMGRIPFDHVYIHPKILDGRGETMSKSKGNGVDPVDIIHTHGADALRYTMADMCTETQDIRMPVEYVCPVCGKLTDQQVAIKNEEQRRKSTGIKIERKIQPADCHVVKCASKECGKEFATQWAPAETKAKLPVARETSDKFDIGRNFCNKLWNAARFALMNLEGAGCETLDVKKLPPEDRWILAELSEAIRKYHECLATYQFAASVRVLREFFWDALCDWYIELTKPRLSPAADDGGEQLPPDPTAKQVLAFCIDQSMRLWHPTMPFITERIWAQLNETAPSRGLPGVADLDCEELLVTAAFPPVDGYTAFDDADMRRVFGEIQSVVRAIRDLRTTSKISPKQAVVVTVVLAKEACKSFESQKHIVLRMANVESLKVTDEAARPANSGSITMGMLRVFVHDISDDEQERKRCTKALENVDKQIKGKESKLSNEKFVSSAPAEVVDAERARVTALKEERDALRAALDELEG